MTGTECPSGFECVQNVCRAAGETRSCSEVLGDAGPRDGAPDGGGPDTDGDRVADSQDNCATVANTDQHNEDGDMLGDACDPCPILGAPTLPEAMLDSDNDTIGDSCDPRPTLAGDRVLLFATFAEPPPGVIVGGSTVMFTYQNDKASVTLSNDGQANAAFLPAGYDPARQHMMFTSLRFTSVPTGGTHYRGAGLLDRFNNGTGITCSAGLAPNQNPTNGIFATESFNTTENVLTARGTSTPVMMGSQFGLNLTSLDVMTWTCIGTGTGPFTASAPAAGTTGMGFGIHARSVGVEFDYLYVVDYPP